MTKEVIVAMAQLKGAVQVLNQLIEKLTEQRDRLQQQFDSIQEVE